ncbi:MAG: acyl-[acyl-carrier-protein]--UDP-N-acetylglucosamine O-acyltransferase, partial [Chloracidobacterium sp.]
QFCRVGTHAFIGAYSVVVKDALPYARSVGNHAKCYGPNSLGLRRAGFSSEDLRAIEQAFRLLLNSKLNTSQAVAAMTETFGNHPRIHILLDFIATSQRGVIK